MVHLQTMLNNLTKGNDLRSRLSAPRKGTQFRDAIQVVVTNTTATKSNSLKLNDSEVIIVRNLIALCIICIFTFSKNRCGFYL